MSPEMTPDEKRKIAAHYTNELRQLRFEEAEKWWLVPGRAVVPRPTV